MKKVQEHRKLTDDAFNKAFEDCSLNPKMFSHEAHIRLAWIHIRKFGVEKAVANIQELITSYVNY